MSRLRMIRTLLMMSAIIVTCSTMKIRPAMAESHDLRVTKKVNIPGTDHFVPFALQIKVGDSVQWTNSDTDDHTIVSDDVYTSPRFRGVNRLLPGTDSNGGKPGVFTLKFRHPGTFIYYCRFHSKLDDNNQPVAPGPKGGIQDSTGNFGTPMMGVITVMP